MLRNKTDTQLVAKGMPLSEQQRYDELVQTLDSYGYAVSRSEHGYLVVNRADSRDISYARNLDDLADFAELMRWREQYTIRRQQGR